MLRRAFAVLSIVALTILPLAGCAGEGDSATGDDGASSSAGSDSSSNTTTE